MSFLLRTGGEKFTESKQKTEVVTFIELDLKPTKTLTMMMNEYDHEGIISQLHG